MNESDMMETVAPRNPPLAALAEAMAIAQKCMPAAKFDCINPHFRSRYASLASVAEVAKVAAAAGISYFQDIEHNEHGIRCATTLMHKTGQSRVSYSPWFKPSKPDAHGIASCVTYARRIGLSTALCIVADSDDDGNAAVDKSVPASEEVPAPLYAKAKKAAADGQYKQFWEKLTAEQRKSLMPKHEELKVIKKDENANA